MTSNKLRAINLWQALGFITFRLSHLSIQKSNSADDLIDFKRPLVHDSWEPTETFMRYFAAAFFSLVWCLSLFAQNQEQPTIPAPPVAPFPSTQPQNVPASLAGEPYRIAQDDLLDVTVFEVPELSTSSRVSVAGTLALPLIGAVNAKGRTTEELALIIQDELKKKYINDPHVSIFVKEYASQPVSVLGAVRAPGIYQIRGQKFLMDILAMAQGLDPAAGKTIQIIRRTSDEPNISDSSNAPPKTETISIDVADLFQNGRTELNIRINAGDVINVLPALSIFVVGEFARPGEFPLRFGKPITVAQAVALGGGFSRDAKKAGGSIIRYHMDRTKEEIPVNIQKILDGSADDVPLIANDILFVPSNKVKTGLSRALDSAVAIAVGRAIYIR